MGNTGFIDNIFSNFWFRPCFDKEKPLPAEIIANLEAYYGLDDPLWKQYTDYLWNALHGDFGPSYSSRSRTVNDIISAHFPVSAQLGILAVIVAMVVGIPLGMVSALKQNSFIDYSCMLFALLGVSVPAMTLGPLLIWFFALKLHILPVARWGTWQQAIMPAFTLGIVISGLQDQKESQKKTSPSIMR